MDNALQDAICGFKKGKLKKGKTVDKSAPVIGKPKTGGGGGGGNDGGGAPPPMGGGGLMGALAAKLQKRSNPSASKPMSSPKLSPRKSPKTPNRPPPPSDDVPPPPPDDSVPPPPPDDSYPSPMKKMPTPSRGMPKPSMPPIPMNLPKTAHHSVNSGFGRSKPTPPSFSQGIDEADLQRIADLELAVDDLRQQNTDLLKQVNDLKAQVRRISQDQSKPAPKSFGSQPSQSNQPSLARMHTTGFNRSMPSRQPKPASHWTRVTDPGTNDYYYWNTVTNETSWDKPPDFYE